MRHFASGHDGTSKSDTVSITAAACGETKKALLVRLQNGKEKWVPQSVIHDDSEVFNSTHTTPARLVVLGWWARKEGLG